MKTAGIITIGNELLYGSVVDTNASYIGQRVTEIGLEPVCIITVGDKASQITQALEIACKKVDVLFITGGLGPTHDDITKRIIAESIGQDLVFNSEILKNIEMVFTQRKITMPKSNRIQAYFPRKAKIIANSIGTAPGFQVQYLNTEIFVMPGVPCEMEQMLDEQVLPWLTTLSQGKTILHRWIKTTGIGESSLSLLLENVIKKANNIKIASLPQETGVNLRLTAEGKDKEEAGQHIQAVEDVIVNKASQYIYGMDDDLLEEVVGRLLSKTKATVAVAESCTGGQVASLITNAPGSSAYFIEGVITYSNFSKIARLDVAEATIRCHGAVSAQTAAEMAQGVRQISGATYGLSTTGIAGPSGGTKAKPIGLVYLGLADSNGVKTEKLMLGMERKANKTQAALASLNLLRQFLVNGKGHSGQSN